jgi:organic radical activating enzyme
VPDNLSQEKEGVQEMTELNVAPRENYYADLHWFSTCNYNCPYCFTTNLPPGEGWKTENVNKIIEFFDTRPEQWHIHLLGGEVTIHPMFNELFSRLTKRHTLDIVMNNSWSTEKLN